MLCVLALVSFRAEDFIFNIVILYTQKTTAKGEVWEVEEEKKIERNAEENIKRNTANAFIIDQTGSISCMSSICDISRAGQAVMDTTIEKDRGEGRE